MLNIKAIKPEDLWYVVGYIATDGCLSKDGRHTTLVSKDIQILEDIKQAIGLNNSKICNHRGGLGTMASHINISSRKFYKFLEEIGLTPKKSLTLGSLNIPESYFKDFLRGVIDGDGSIYSWIHRTNSHTQWSLRFHSGSEVFSKWLKNETEKYFNVQGKLHTRKLKGRNPLYIVKFGKMAARVILGSSYYKDCLVLERKNKAVQDCIKTKNLFKKYGNVINCSGDGIGRHYGLKIR